MTTFARIKTQEVPTPRDFVDFWLEPSSSFLAPGEAHRCGHAANKCTDAAPA